MLKDIAIFKQGELDFTCGLYCLTSVADHFGIKMDYDRPFSTLVGKSEQGLKAKGTWKSRVMPLVWGIGVDGMKRLGNDLGLKCSILEPAGDLDALKDAYMSIALVFTEFNHPQGEQPSYLDSHYLITMSEEGLLYLADSHPWMPHMRPVNDEMFDSMWNDPRLDIKGWALTFPADQSPRKGAKK